MRQNESKPSQQDPAGSTTLATSRLEELALRAGVSPGWLRAHLRDLVLAALIGNAETR